LRGEPAALEDALCEPKLVLTLDVPLRFGSHMFPRLCASGLHTAI